MSCKCNRLVCLLALRNKSQRSHSLYVCGVWGHRHEQKSNITGWRRYQHTSDTLYSNLFLLQSLRKKGNLFLHFSSLLVFYTDLTIFSDTEKRCLPKQIVIRFIEVNIYFPFKYLGSSTEVGQNILQLIHDLKMPLQMF